MDTVSLSSLGDTISKQISWSSSSDNLSTLSYPHSSSFGCRSCVVHASVGIIHPTVVWSLHFDQLWFPGVILATASTLDHGFISSFRHLGLTALPWTICHGKEGMVAGEAWSVAAGACGEAHSYLHGSRSRANLQPCISSLKSPDLPE